MEILKHPMFFTNVEIEKMFRDECVRRGWTIAGNARPEMKCGTGDYTLIGAFDVCVRVEIEVMPVTPRAK